MEAGEGKGGWPVPGGSPHTPKGGAVDRVPLLWGGGSESVLQLPPAPPAPWPTGLSLLGAEVRWLSARGALRCRGRLPG